MGALQLAVYFTHLNGQPQDSCPAATTPLDTFPSWARVLPRDITSVFSQHPPAGFGGQMARCTLYVEQVLLPEGDDVVLERPSSCCYAAVYRLPGAWGRVASCVSLLWTGSMHAGCRLA